MQLGMIGLGRMGANMVRRLLKGGHACTVLGRSAEAVGAMAREGAIGAASLAELVAGLDRPLAEWLMVPAAAVDPTIGAPLRDPQHFAYDLSLPDIAELRRRGSVISSWLLDLTAAALADDPALAGFEGRVSDSGEGRWTIKAAIDEGVPAPVLSSALYARFASRSEAGFQDRLLSAMRWQFGGHREQRSCV